ncbi:MAG TPA: thymidylate synthase [Ktedonobacterales bacterium]
MSQIPLTLAMPTLVDLLAAAHETLLRDGMRHETPRGPTRSLNAVTLTWQSPDADHALPLPWTARDVAWYLDTFVSGHTENDPARPRDTGELVFPYTYAARSRFWDAGWGYLHAAAMTLREAGLHPARLTASRHDFAATLATLGERLHLQTVLSLCAAFPREALLRWLANPAEVAALMAGWRRDTVASAIDDIAVTPGSRRAVVTSLSYPHLEDALIPRMGMPPYQLFQYLPGEQAEPLATIHVHRSLDVLGGVPLDLHHDLLWLREAARQTGRPVGSITVVAHNLHLYERPDLADRDGEDIETWLCRVTDGYRTGDETAARLLAEPAYAANADRIWARWDQDD